MGKILNNPDFVLGNGSKNKSTTYKLYLRTQCNKLAVKKNEEKYLLIILKMNGYLHNFIKNY